MVCWRKKYPSAKKAAGNHSQHVPHNITFNSILHHYKSDIVTSPAVSVEFIRNKTKKLDWLNLVGFLLADFVIVGLVVICPVVIDHLAGPAVNM